jgi:dihydroxy-acid dehydratase
MVGHVCPEAALGGPIARVHDGDRIRIDVAARRLDVLADLAGRTPAPRPARALVGVMRKYAASVASASDGAITSDIAAWRRS